MKNKQTQEAISVMQAFLEGKQIQSALVHHGGNFFHDDDNPSWNWNEYVYRVKPEPKYIPYISAEDVFKDAVKHDWAVIADKKQDLIFISRDSVRLAFGKRAFYLSDAFEKLTWIDGTPFGTKVKSEEY